MKSWLLAVIGASVLALYFLGVDPLLLLAPRANQRGAESPLVAWQRDVGHASAGIDATPLRLLCEPNEWTAS